MRTSEQTLRSLMVAGLEGDGAAHHALLEALTPVLRAYFGRRVDGAAAEDLVQDTLIAVHMRRATWDRSRAFSPWLFAIARYRLIDHFRRTRAHVPIETVEAYLADEGFADAAGARLDVDALLKTLPSKQARAIHATRIEGLDTVEAADRLGIGQSDLKISVHRGLKALARRISGP